MPFTLTHPAAAVPLLKPLGRFGSLSALIIGSMTPDLPYFIDLDVSRTWSHSLEGLLWFCLPAALVCYAVFHWLLRPGLVLLMPIAVRARLPAEASLARLPSKGFLAVCVSSAAGAFTHIVWDWFTHGSGPVGELLPVLQVLPALIPARLKRHLLEPSGTIIRDRYEFMVYRQLRDGLEAGDLHCRNSARFRSFDDDLVDDETFDRRAELFPRHGLERASRPLREQLDELRDLVGA